VGEYIVTESEIVVLHEDGKLTKDNIADLLTQLKSLQKVAPNQQKPLSEPTLENRRRSQRVMLQIVVLVKAEMPEGDRLQTLATTVVVNAHGGLLTSPLKMVVGQKVKLVNPQTEKEVGCRVVRVQSTSEGSFMTAFEFERRIPWFWPVEFPPLDWGLMEQFADNTP
jgi:hypothetical protein